MDIRGDIQNAQKAEFFRFLWVLESPQGRKS
jgi:hypothetical protein